MAATKKQTKTTSGTDKGARRGRKEMTDAQKQAEKDNPNLKFVRLAKFRMSKTLANLGQVKRLARYPHTPEQGARIVAALTEALNAVEVSFSETKRGETKETFEF